MVDFMKSIPRVLVRGDKEKNPYKVAPLCTANQLYQQAMGDTIRQFNNAALTVLNEKKQNSK